MNSKEYKEGALLTESNDFEAIDSRITNSKIRLLHAGMGMVTESGEFVDMLKKHVFYGKELDRVNLFEEVGDLMWYCAIALDELGESFESCMEKNNEKLMARYNRKKFNKEDAVNRDLEKERKILEKNE